MNEVDTKSAVLNLYYLVDDFRSTKPFGELLIELANNSFGLYIVYLQIYSRVFLNNLRDVTDFITESCLLEVEIKKNVGVTKQKIFSTFLSCYCQRDKKKLLSYLNLVLNQAAFEHIFYTYKSDIDYNSDNFKMLNLK